MIQQLQQEKKKITEFPRASNPYAELLKLYIFIHKKLQIKIETFFSSVGLPFCKFQLRIDLK